MGSNELNGPVFILVPGTGGFSGFADTNERTPERTSLIRSRCASRRKLPFRSRELIVARILSDIVGFLRKVPVHRARTRRKAFLA